MTSHTLIADNFISSSTMVGDKVVVATTGTFPCSIVRTKCKFPTQDGLQIETNTNLGSIYAISTDFKYYYGFEVTGSTVTLVMTEPNYSKLKVYEKELRCAERASISYCSYIKWKQEATKDQFIDYFIYILWSNYLSRVPYLEFERECRHLCFTDSSNQIMIEYRGTKNIIEYNQSLSEEDYRIWRSYIRYQPRYYKALIETFVPSIKRKVKQITRNSSSNQNLIIHLLDGKVSWYLNGCQVFSRSIEGKCNKCFVGLGSGTYTPPTLTELHSEYTLSYILKYVGMDKSGL